MKILGIDYGSKRIGLAISDELGITARPLAVIERKNLDRDLDVLENFLRETNAGQIVLGLPLRLDGTRGIQCEKVDKFAAALKERFPLPVILWDEALSTWEADELMISAGIKGRKRRKMVDKIAAGIILQSYLNSLHAKRQRDARSEEGQ
jgi:putative holliday junction resolvase